MATNYEIGQTFTPDDLRDMALQVADHYDVPKDLFLGLNAHESSWNPLAKNPKSSARGLGQFIDGTAKSYFDEPITNDENDPRYHPGKSLDASARYLKDLYGQHGDWEKAVLHYGENTPAYLNMVKAAAGREADEHDHFIQGQFMQGAGGADLGFGMSPAYQDTRRGPAEHITGTSEGLHPQVLRQFDLMAQEFYEKTGEPLIIASGRRSTERQAELYAADPSSGYVAKPGTSKHETGEAIDLDRRQVKKIEELGLLEKYGFHRPMQGQGARKINEPWHIQLTDEFKQGQFMEAAGGADLGFGMSPMGQEAQPGALYQGIREYLGLNKEPWKMSPVMEKIAADYMKVPAIYPGMTQEEQDTADLASGVAQAAPLGLSGEDLLFPGQRQKDVVESEAQRVMGRFVDGYTASLTEGAKKAAFGDTFKPETALGSAIGQGAYLAGQIMGPFKLIKMLTGSYLFPTVEGLRTTSHILTAGMKEGAVNLGLLQGLGGVVPAMIEHEDFSKWAFQVLADAKGGALVGAAFPMLSLVPGQGAVGAGLRMAAGFAAMDYMRAGKGKWTTLGDFYHAFQTWDEESKKQFASLSYQYLLDLYFANSVRPIRETMAAYNQHQILQEMAKLKPQELEKEILAVTGQQPPDALTELWKNRGAAGRLEQKVEAGQPIGERELRQAQAEMEGVQPLTAAVQEEIGRLVDAGQAVPPELWSRYRTLNELAQVSAGGEKAPAEAQGEPGPVTVETPEIVKEINPDVAASVEVAAPIAATARGKRPELALTPLGSETTVRTERGMAVQVRWGVFEADELLTSHDTALNENPEFPRELQPRERSRLTSQMQIGRIRTQLQPEFLGESPKASEGAPIVGKDLIVESGNARTLALKGAYDAGEPKAQEYRQWLLDNAGRFGLDAKQLEGMGKPVLVQVRQTEVDRPEFVRQANEAAVAGLSAVEQAKADAVKLTGINILSRFIPNDRGLIVSRENQAFIRRFMEEVVGPNELTRYFTREGEISQEGINRVRNALFAAAYGDSASLEKLAESPDDLTRNVTGALTITAPRAASLNRRIGKGELHDLSLSKNIADAAQILQGLRESGQPVDKYLRQQKLFTQDDPLTADLLKFSDAFKLSRVKIAEVLNRYYDLVEALGNPKQKRLLGPTEIPKLQDVLQTAIERMEAKHGKGKEALQADLFQGEPGGGEKAASAPGPEGTKRPAEAVTPAEQPQPYKLYAGFPGPGTGEILARLKEGTRESRGLWSELKTNIREIIAPATLPDAKEVAKGLITMMGRKNEAINQAHFRLLDFRDLFRDTPVAEWGKLAATWQAGGKTGTDLDRAYEVYHEISDALVPQVRDYRDLAYQENYLRQAWRNARDPEFKANIGNFREGKPFKNYLDLDEQGNPRIYKAIFAEDGSFTVERQEGAAEPAGARVEPEPLTGVPRGRTLPGGRGYFKEKKIPDWQTGLMLGGVPKFKNLFDLMIFDIGEKNQFIWGNEFIKWAREKGYLQYVSTRKIPQGWARINDPRGLIRHPYLKEIEAETRPFDQVSGDYDLTAPPKTEPRVMEWALVAPKEAARIINNFLSPGLWGQPFYNLYRNTIDPLRRLGVSFSTYHLRFTMNNSLATGTGQALSKAMGDLFSGDVEGLAQAVKSGALNLTGASFIRQLGEGKTLAEAFYKGTEDPVLRGTLRRFIDSGGTLPGPESMLPMIREFGKGVWQSLVELGRVHPFRAAGELIDATSKPIMTYGVPFAKLGAFPVLERALQDRLEAKYAKLGPETAEIAAQREAEFRQGLFDINRHLDNIYGQMNYDALLFNRKVKDMLFFVIKFPGWNIGSGRWLGAMVSGLKNTGIPGKEASEYEKESLRMGLGLVINMGIYSSLLYWFINGRPPEDVAELYTKGVWTGGYTRSGNKEYIRDASYWRDLWGMIPVGQHGGFAPGKPIETVKAKAADIWRIPVEVMDNREVYSGNQIFTPPEPGAWTAEGLRYLGKQAIPYSFRGMAQASSPWGRFGSFVGWTPTPARLTDTPAMQEMRSHRQAEAPTMITTQKQGQREVKRDIMDFVYEGDGPGFLAALRQARAEGQITSSQYKGMVRDGHEILRDPHYGPLRNSFRKLNDLDVAIKVYGLATPEEREALGNLMQQKWSHAQPDTRRQHRQEFMELKTKIAAGQ